MFELLLIILVIVIIYFWIQKKENFVWKIAENYPDPIAAHWEINRPFIDGWTPYDIMLSPHPIVRKTIEPDPPQFYNLNSLDSNLIRSDW